MTKKRRPTDCMKCGKPAWNPADFTWMLTNEEWASVGFKPTDVYCLGCYRELRPNGPKPITLMTIDD